MAKNKEKNKEQKPVFTKENGVKAVGNICSLAGELLFCTGIGGMLPIPGLKKKGGVSVPDVTSLHGGHHIHM